MRKLTAATLVSVAALSLGAGAAFASPDKGHHPSEARASHDRGSPDRPGSLDRHDR
jgi:hypothetical protein